MRYVVAGCLSAALVFGQSAAGQSAKALLDKGLEAVRATRLAEAQDDFEKAIAADPKLEEAYVQLADVYLRERKSPLNSPAALELSSKAENELRRAMELNAGDRRASAGLAVLLYRSALETKDETQKAARFDEAAALFKKLAGTPSNDSKQMYLALAQIDLTRTSQEMGQPSLTDIRPLLDDARRKDLKDKYGAFIADGIENAKAALDFDPKWTAARTTMSGLLRERALLRDDEANADADWKSSGDYLKVAPPSAAPPPPLSKDEIVADLTEAVQRRPDFATAYIARAMTYYGLRKYDEAFSDFQKALELKPSEAVPVYTNRSRVYDALKQYDNEIADLTKLIELKPTDLNVRLRRADAYRVSGHCDLAIADYTRLIDGMRTLEAYRGRADCRTKMGDAQGASEDQNKIQELTAKVAAAAGAKQIAPANTPAPPGDRLAHLGAAAIPPNVYRIGGGVSQPAILFKVEPEYSEEARKAKWQGTVELSIVVDEFGAPKVLNVTKRLGLGLDEKAIEAVEQWVFKPGQKDGKPVAVYAIIQVNFKLL
jgi:TonB family protein